MSAQPRASREPTRIDAIAEEHFRARLALDPAWAIELGAPDHGWGYRDFTSAGLEAERQTVRTALGQLEHARPLDDVDRVTAHALRERLGLQAELHDRGLAGTRINGISSPVQKIREAFDNLPRQSAEDWEVIARQLEAVPEAVTSALEGLCEQQQHGPVTAAAQLAGAADQARGYAGPDGSFQALTRSCRAVRLPETLQRRIDDGAAEARRAYDGFAIALRQEAQTAPERMAVGPSEYALRLREFTGLDLDPRETYEWGVELLRGVVAEMEEVAGQLVPDHVGPARIPAAIAALDADPRRQLHGREELIRWMEGVVGHALDALGDGPFEITEDMRALECRIAPTTDGGIYYTPPSADLSRPGRMWWSVPEGRETFRTWGERTTVYHEGVPGHHLQFATAVARGEHLNLWRRLGLWVSGHGEGWALYAEQLMAELGFLQDPGDRMGMLNAQRMRAARVVFDIGFHCGLPIPTQLADALGRARPGQVWTPQDGWEFLQANIVMDPASLRFEWMRYMGWPGQAPAYSIGMRAWERARQDAATREGEAFDLPRFHSRALGIGSVGLSTLDYALSL